MKHFFKELDYQKTSLGELVLRCRKSPSVSELVYEAKLDNDMLMSSSVNVSEKALATLVLNQRKDRQLDVLIGGLGLGYTAAAALEYPNVKRIEVVELLAPVIEWHKKRLIPLADVLLDDSRCSLIQADFFEYINPVHKDSQYDAILLDIDHAPDCVLQQTHSEFYRSEGLQNIAGCLRPEGIFALWSAWQPPAEFFNAIKSVFTKVGEHQISFLNPHMHKTYTNWIITAEK